MPEATTLDIMGHMSAAMRCSHIRKEAKIEAIEAIEARPGFCVAVHKESSTVNVGAKDNSAVTH